MDPITNLATVATQAEVKSVLMRLVDFFKNKKITTLFTNLAHPGETEITESGVSSLMDTWILLSYPEFQGERNRNLFILKSRGMAHSNQVREFLITDQGLELMDVYLGAGGVLTGRPESSRMPGSWPSRRPRPWNWSAASGSWNRNARSWKRKSPPWRWSLPGRRLISTFLNPRRPGGKKSKPGSAPAGGLASVR